MTFRTTVILLVLVLTTACGRQEFGATTGGGEVIGTDVDRAKATTPDGSATSGDAFEGNNGVVQDPSPPADLSGGRALAGPDFAFLAYQSLKPSGRNAALAPHALARSLVVAHAAAGPDEAAAIASIVEPYLGGEIYGGFNSTDLDLDARQSTGGFEMLPSVWLQEGVAVETDFVELLARYLGLQLRVVDFATSPEDARNTINNWYSGETDGRISEVLGPRTLDENTRFVVTDATSFASEWAFNGFDPGRTTFETFAGTESSVQLPMMATDDVFLHVAAPDFDAVVLPFANGFSMLAVLPENLESFEAALDPEFLNRLIDEASPTDVALRFPRIEVSDRVSLSSVADVLGVRTLFADDTEFSAFADGTQLHDAHQRTRIAFDEFGVVAGTDDGNVVGDNSGEASAPLELRFDRPFFFAIRDGETGLFVVLGRFAQP